MRYIRNPRLRLCNLDKVIKYVRIRAGFFLFVCFYFFIEFIEVTLVNKTIQVSGVQSYSTLSVYCIVSINTKQVSFQSCFLSLGFLDSEQFVAIVHCGRGSKLAAYVPNLAGRLSCYISRVFNFIIVLVFVCISSRQQ